MTITRIKKQDVPLVQLIISLSVLLANKILCRQILSLSLSTHFQGHLLIEQMLFLKDQLLMKRIQKDN